jgi:hypothetical protein
MAFDGRLIAKASSATEFTEQFGFSLTRRTGGTFR